MKSYYNDEKKFLKNLKNCFLKSYKSKLKDKRLINRLLILDDFTKNLFTFMFLGIILFFIFKWVI